MNDTAGRALPFAMVGIEGSIYRTTTNSAGQFILEVTPGDAVIQLMVASAGMQTTKRVIPANRADLHQNIRIVMQELSLRLNMVEVNVRRKPDAVSNSSIFFDRELIEQLQATSIADVLKFLPGKTITNPSLQSPNQLTLRTEGDGATARNNAFGTAIIIDDIQMSNNANMQHLSIGRWGLGGTGAIVSEAAGSGDFANAGIDLRQIPVDNVESIEVVSGVPSARYGDLTDGMVNVLRQAGRTPLQVSVRLRGATTNASAGQGFNLKGKNGAINYSFNILNANDDPRDNLKSYTRLSAGLMWSRYFGKKDFIKNTLSFDFSKNLDKQRVDPDDDDKRQSRFNYTGISMSNRTSAKWKSAWFKQSSLNLSFSISENDSFDEWYVNKAPFPVADGMTTGTYEGYWTAGNFAAARRVLGKPVSAALRQENTLLLHTGRLEHEVVAGVNMAYADNLGKGQIVDPAKPRFQASGGVTGLFTMGERPFTFKYVPAEVNTGAYVEDRFRFQVFDRLVRMNAGVRADWQNGGFSVSPRINMNYELSKKWKFNLAYGTASKSASLSMRNPGPVYFDMPLVNRFADNAVEALYLVHTEVMRVNNNDLKPMHSRSWEAGFSYDDRLFSASVFGYYKTVRDGFGTTVIAAPVTLPVYGYTANPGAPTTYFETGLMRRYPLSYDKAVNNLNSNTMGMELMVSTRKIKFIQTSFDLSTAFNSTYYRNSGRSIAFIDRSNVNWDKPEWFGVYESSARRSSQTKSTLSANTHIQALGMVASMVMEVFWQQRTVNYGQDEYAVGYYDSTMQYHDIPEDKRQSPQFAHLTDVQRNSKFSLTDRPRMYTNYHLRLSKEITRNIRFSFNINNVFNYRPTYFNELSNSLIVFNAPPSYGAELTFKF
ncbi:TonB-dependent receptor [uncultured Chitinophaga sp.]|uniref:TonB-dependent receptor n=1 Tax=uncultured Chitinophaga sp. TaxID=339340 RepID=UPI0025F30162|nr:TonB-dependent receptor [uncultured Chitinophaga sp.]